MAGLIYKQWRAETKLLAPGKHEYLVRMAVSGDDRDDDIIDHKGWVLDHFNAHPVLVSSHVYDDLRKQIGEWRDLDVSKGDLRGVATYYAGEGNEEADWADNLAAKGRAAYSVGFVPLESEPRKGHSGFYYRRNELLETSHVIIPSGREALQLMVKGVTADPHGLRAELAREALAEMDKQPRRRTWRGFTPQRKAEEMGGDEATCVQMAQDLLDRLNALILHEAQEQVDGEDEDDDIRLLLTCRDMIQQFQRNEMLGDGGDYGYGYGMGYAYMAIDGWLAKHRDARKAGRRNSAEDSSRLMAIHDHTHALLNMPAHGAADADQGDEEPATERDKAAKAMSEGAGDKGGVTVSESGTHGAFTGKHSHAHDAAGHTTSADGDGNHEHMHSHAGDGNHGHSHDGANFKTARERAEAVEKSHSELPDSAFAYIEPGGTVEDGKTRPLSLRHYPHHTESGAVDKGLLRSALSRIADSSNEQGGKAHLEEHAKTLGIGEAAEDKDKTWRAAMDARLDALLAGVTE